MRVTGLLLIALGTLALIVHETADISFFGVDSSRESLPVVMAGSFLTLGLLSLTLSVCEFDEGTPEA